MALKSQPALKKRFVSPIGLFFSSFPTDRWKIEDDDDLENENEWNWFLLQFQILHPDCLSGFNFTSNDWHQWLAPRYLPRRPSSLINANSFGSNH